MTYRSTHGNLETQTHIDTDPQTHGYIQTRGHTHMIDLYVDTYTHTDTQTHVIQTCGHTAR